MIVYCLLGTLSVLDVCGAIAYEEDGENDVDVLLVVDRVLSSVCDFCAAHTILMLATIVHRTPSIAPYNYLLWAMRCIALLLLATECTRLATFFRVFQA